MDEATADSIAVSVTAALGFAFLFTPDFGFDSAVLMGLAVGGFVAATLFFVVNRELEAEAAHEIRAYFWAVAFSLLIFGGVPISGWRFCSDSRFNGNSLVMVSVT